MAMQPISVLIDAQLSRRYLNSKQDKDIKETLVEQLERNVE